MVDIGTDAGHERLAERLDADAVELLQELLEETGGLDHADETIAGSIASLHDRDLRRRLAEIDGLMPLADSQEKDMLTLEKMRLVEEIRALGGSRSWKQFQ
jgi:hypothetical protein